MQEIIFQQRNAAKPLTGKAFVLNIAKILIALTIAQIIANALISLTGIGLLNAAFYLYAVWLLIMFMRDTVAGYVYTLKEGVLVLERKLGDSTITVIEVPLDKVASLRPVRMGENLHISYRDVMHIDACTRPPARVRAAFILSLFSARLARLAAGRRVQDVIGHVIVFDEGSVRRACTFCPNAELLEKLEECLGERFDFDERMTRARIRTLYARALERAFPALYAHVEPLLSREEAQWAREEIERQKAERKAKKTAGKTNEAAQETAQTPDEIPDEAPVRRRRKQG